MTPTTIWTIRFFLLSAHYRSPVNYSKEVLDQAKSALERLYNCAEKLDFYVKHTEAAAGEEATQACRDAIAAHRAHFIEAMDYDFNTADGISVLFDLAKEINTGITEGNLSHADALAWQEIFSELCDLFGFVKEAEADDDRIAKIEAAIAERAAAKKAKDYARADAIRAELLAQGVVLKDTAQGTQYQFVE